MSIIANQNFKFLFFIHLKFAILFLDLNNIQKDKVSFIYNVRIRVALEFGVLLNLPHLNSDRKGSERKF